MQKIPHFSRTFQQDFRHKDGVILGVESRDSDYNVPFL